MITATIYQNTRDNKMYVLNEMITMDDKICLVPMDKRTDDKFVSPKTLKRWYSKRGEAQYIVEVKAFTGMKLGLFEATKRDGNIEVWTKDNKLLVFDATTDKQVNAKNPKFANKLGMCFGFCF